VGSEAVRSTAQSGLVTGRRVPRASTFTLRKRYCMDEHRIEDRL
jgi:hypothetical protein